MSPYGKLIIPLAHPAPNGVLWVSMENVRALCAKNRWDIMDVLKYIHSLETETINLWVA